MARLRVVLSAALLAPLLPAVAAACDSSGCFLATRGPRALPAKGRVALDLTFRRTAEDDPMSGTGPAAAALRPWADFEGRTLWPGYHEDLRGSVQVLQLDVAWGVTKSLAVTASVPLRTLRSYDVGHGDARLAYRTRGIGDVVLGVRRSLRAGGVELVGGLAAKLPTGRSDVVSPEDGAIMDPMVQPGTGATDLQVSAQAFARRSFDCSASVSWQRAGTSARGFRFGNEWIGALSASRTLAGPVSGSLQLKLADRGRALYLGRDVDGTGLRTVYLTPGLRVRAGTGAAFYGYVPIPLHRRVNETQLGPGRGLLLGVSRTF